MPAFIDLTGKTFRYLTAIKRVANRDGNRTCWQWHCMCGKDVEIISAQVTSGRRISCGCKAPNRLIDLTGMTFGRWTVVSRATGMLWRCVCECGDEKLVVGQNLRDKKSKSCFKCSSLKGDNNPSRKAAMIKHGKILESKASWYKRATAIYRRCRDNKIEFGFSSASELAVYLSEIDPKYCPVFGFLMIDGNRGFDRYAPSVDRIDPRRGYVRDNIQIISMKANTMKDNATPEELVRFANWILSG